MARDEPAPFLLETIGVADRPEMEPERSRRRGTLGRCRRPALGSGDGRGELQIVARAAERVGAIGVVLHDVPNQPLIRPDLVEDNLIAHT
ncbi:MAG: PhoPQ-activated pathogenicity-related family protein, partial [Geminicoccaceae bacterium]|nr:PhoPQ-activated pathogenicity-related family protein [Geminicoccaceae bacterium]